MDKPSAAEMMAAADHVKSLATKFKAIVDLADYVGRIGVVTQAAEEAEARHARALVDVAKVEADLVAVRADVVTAGASRDRIMAAAVAQAGKIEHEAREKAAATISSAEKEAAAIKAKAEHDAAGILSGANAQLAAAQKEAATARAELATVNAAKDAAAGELEVTNRKIAAARAAIAQALG